MNQPVFRKSLCALVLLAVLCGMLAGCGNKGPLKRAVPQTAAAAPHSEPAPASSR